jgi:hypothetical protein
MLAAGGNGALPVMRIAAVLLLCVATAAAAAPAATGEGPSPEQLFQQFGLFGTWAGDCAAKPSPANPHIKISQPAPGVILEDHDLGPDNVVNRYSILAAEKLSDTQLAVHAIFQPGKEGEERQTLVWSVHDGTLRTLFNQPQGGPVRVKDGVAVRYGIKTPVLRKCK